MSKEFYKLVGTGLFAILAISVGLIALIYAIVV